LNNAATTFLARGDFLEACLCSRDGLSLIESIVRLSLTFENATSENIDNTRTDGQFLKNDVGLSEKIRHVDKRLAATQAPTAKSLLPIEILCYDGSFDSRRTLLEHHTKECWKSTPAAMPIWISDVIVGVVDEFDALYMNLTEIVPSIMLLNFAISRLFNFKYSESESALIGSLRLFRMSMKVRNIEFDQSNSNQVGRSNATSFTEGHLFIALAVLLNMTNIIGGSENSYLPLNNAGSCSASIVTTQPCRVSLPHEMLNDLVMLQEISEEWIAYSLYMHIESCIFSAAAA
jgi:hypothetical protein